MKTMTVTGKRTCLNRQLDDISKNILKNRNWPFVIDAKVNNFFSVPDCSKAADVAFIVDSSGSIGKTNWERTKRFLMRIVSKLDVGPTTTHIAAISYSTNPEIALRFNTLSGSKLNVDEVVKVLDGLRWQRGFTYIDKALEQAAQGVFTTAAGMRSNVPKVMICLIVA